jgi:hypothetical protein
VHEAVVIDQLHQLHQLQQPQHRQHRQHLPDTRHQTPDTRPDKTRTHLRPVDAQVPVPVLLRPVLDDDADLVVSR